jgi:hypothetical protein
MTRSGLGSFSRVALGALLSGWLLGCAKNPQVHADNLPVKRVVVYRNGVAYFERSGTVSHERVEFQLREENVGDFLATLAVMEHGGHSVKAASFPVSMAEQEQEPPDPELERALDAWSGKKTDPRKLRNVTLELDGDKHQLTVGYLAETPLWRPSYRLVVGKSGEASLQVWGIVQNQSGEDWNDIQLSLVAGAPIAFESTLGDPVVPQRPIVSDEGEVIYSVPQGEASYHQEEAAEADMGDQMSGSLDEGPGYGSAAGAMAPKAAQKRAQGKDMDGDAMMESAQNEKPSAPPAPAPSMATLAPRDASRMARVEVQSGATRYEVPHTVSVPDESATMVLLVSKKVPGQAVHLFAPDGGVPDSYRHPFRVARFKNTSGGLLEKGPIAVFEEGAFLGQGMLSSLPVKAEAIVPFALVRDLAIETVTRWEQRDVRFYAVRSGHLFIEQDQATLTTYKVQNGDQEPAKLLLRHPRAADARLYKPPAGTEDNLAEHVAYVPAAVPKFGKTEVVVDERRPVQMSVAWESVEARQAVGAFLAAGKGTPAQRKALEQILTQADALAKVADGEAKLRREQEELEKSTRETRLSIESIEKNPAAGTLRAELTSRLRQSTARLDQITKELVELGLRRSELEVRLREARQSLEIPADNATAR